MQISLRALAYIFNHFWWEYLIKYEKK
jgi:hypothetical protein